MNYRRQLSEITSRIHNVFGLQEQGKQLVSLVRKAIGCKWACLFFLKVDSEDFTNLFCESSSADNFSSSQNIVKQSPLIEYLSREKKLLTKDSRTTLPAFCKLWGQEAGEIKLDEVEIFVPMVSRDRLIGILVLANKRIGTYAPDDFRLLEGVTKIVAVSMEKEYLREQLIHLYTEAREQARIDELTGLLNRRSLDEEMSIEINRHSRYGSVFSLIIMDLDSFKTFNDNYGHLVGDKILVEVSSTIRDTIRVVDRAFRYGGDEFAILLPNTSIPAGKQVAERVRNQLASKVITRNLTITASLGLASWPANGKRIMDIITAADTALYHAKRNGGNQIYCTPTFRDS
ncbi:GGDEF domain-containing protein [Chloroflexota bacterium]